MPARFEDAIEEVLENEGGFANHGSDPGGVTQFGVSLRFLRSRGIDIDGDGDSDADDVLALDRAQARQLYLTHFWNRGGYGRLDDQRVATKLFDLSVNMGDSQAHRLFQRALRAAGRDVVEDGVLGPESVGAANATPSDVLLAALRSEAAGFYRALVAGKPGLGVFLRGWLRRAYR